MRGTITAIIAIIAITGLAALALLNGINGTVLTASFTIIGGLGGYSIGKRQSKSVTPSTTLPHPLPQDGKE